MCNGTWACFDCRLTTRRPTWKNVTAARPWLVGLRFGNVRCTRCGQSMRFLGPTIEVPPRRDERAWRALLRQVSEVHGRAVDRRAEHLVRRRHQIEQRIADLRQRPRAVGREELIEGLEHFLRSGRYGDTRHWAE